MNITLYKNFSKRKNSTKQPGGTGTQINAVMKRECSVKNPVFLIDGVDLDVNYLAWNSAYYFVDDIVLSNNNIYELHCTIDMLATYKNTIGGYTTYIERAESVIDEMVNDDLLSASQEIVDISETRAGRPFPATQSGCYIVEVLNSDGITLYATPSLEPFKIIFQSSTYSSQNIYEWIDSKICQAFDLDVYIGSVKWVPFEASAIGTLTNTLKVGMIEMTTGGINMYVVNQSYTYSPSEFAMTLPSGHYSDFRLCNPRFTKFLLYMPGVGTVQLDSAIIGTQIKRNRNLYISSKIDLVSGMVAYRLRAADANGNISNLAEYFACLAVNVPIGKSISNLTETVTGAITTTGSLAAAGAVAGGAYGAVAGAAAGLINTVSNVLTPHVEMLGGSGNKAELLAHQQYEFTEIAYATKDFPIYNAGRPLCEYRQIGTLSGYIKCGGASLDSIAHGSEKDIINNYLNSGFYYE